MLAQQGDFNSQDLVWYAGYGSNLSRGRFMNYLDGGKPMGATTPNPGSRNGSKPLADKPFVIKQFALYFADEKRSVEKWGGAAAFIQPAADSKVLGRMYLITYEQFNDVVLQENGVRLREQLENKLPPPDSIDKKTGYSLKRQIPDSLYDRLVYIGSEGGHPIFTFTTTETLPIGAPTCEYLGQIVPGIHETYPKMLESEIYTYLSRAKGVRCNIAPDQLRRWVSQLLHGHPCK